MPVYLAHKPKEKFDKDAYHVTEPKTREHHFFKEYQEHHNLPGEV